MNQKKQKSKTAKEKIIYLANESGLIDMSVSQIAYAIKEDRRNVDYAIKTLLLNGHLTFRIVRLGIKKIPTKIFTFKK